jgi:hypothetical protein
MSVVITVLVLINFSPPCNSVRLRKSVKTNMSLADLLFTRLNRFSLAKGNQNKVPPALAIPRHPGEKVANINLGNIPGFVNNVADVKTKPIKESIKAVNPLPQPLTQVIAAENYYNHQAGFGPLVESEPGEFVGSKLVNTPKETTPITTPVHSSKIFLNWNEAFPFEPEGREMKSERVEAIRFVPWNQGEFPGESDDNNTNIHIENVESEVVILPDSGEYDSEDFGTEWTVMENLKNTKSDPNNTDYIEYSDYENVFNEHLVVADRRADSDDYSEDSNDTFQDEYYEVVDDSIGNEQFLYNNINPHYVEMTEQNINYDEYYADIADNLDSEEDIYNYQISNLVDEDIYHPDLRYFEGNQISNNVQSYQDSNESYNDFKNLSSEGDFIGDNYIFMGNMLEYNNTDSEKENLVPNENLINNIDNEKYDKQNYYENEEMEKVLKSENMKDNLDQVYENTDSLIENTTIVDFEYEKEDNTNNDIEEDDNESIHSNEQLDELKDQLIHLENMMLKTKEKIKHLYNYEDKYNRRHVSVSSEYENIAMQESTLADKLISNFSIQGHTKHLNFPIDNTLSIDKTNININEATVNHLHDETHEEKETTTEMIESEQETTSMTSVEEGEITESSVRKSKEENIPTIPPSLKAMSYVTLDTISVDMNNNDIFDEMNAKHSENAINKKSEISIKARDETIRPVEDIDAKSGKIISEQNNFLVDDMVESTQDEFNKMPQKLAMTALEENNSIADSFVEKNDDTFYLPAGHGLLYGFKLKDLEKLKKTKLNIFHKSELNI